ncbi:MAG TPA: 50S ribosomal protein L30e [Thermoplasmatales archaeon]|nr:50S ribosomal protein L30e [Thermoplasmatales archaeon]
MVDIERSFKSVMNEGKVIIGLKKTKRALEDGKAKLVVIAKNCPSKKELIEIAKKKGVKFFEFPGIGVELGYTCGKPFAISTFAVLDEGKTDIMKLVEEV